MDNLSAELHYAANAVHSSAGLTSQDARSLIILL